VALSRRSLLNTVRKPTSIIPALTFPLLFLAMSSAAFDRSTALSGFPEVDSFMQFVVATTIIQGALFGSIAAGTDMAIDGEGGFFERLIASPVARTSIIVGRLMGAATQGFVQAWLYIGITSLFGLRVEGGPLAMLLIAVVAALVSAGFGAVSVSFALRTGSAEAVQGSFPMLFVFLFISSAFFPRALMSGWFETVATVNPISHLIEGLRHLVIVGLDSSQFLKSLTVAGGLFVIGVTAANLALKSRLAVHS
jgi:ABC-2 type transport system permease protein